MTWREKIVVQILLIARMLADDPAIAGEIKTLATHINVSAPKPTDTKLEVVGD